jgi:glycosyltransferase involved in cell wall biosynthesis
MAGDPRVELRVLTTDAAGPKRSQRLEVKSLPSSYPGGYPVFFARRLLGQAVAPGLLVRLWSMVGWADVVHLNYTYSFPTIPTLLLARLRNRPVLWSPRGALLASHAWRGARRPWIKWVWERVCRLVASDCVLLHSTSEEERAANLSRLPGMRAVMIPHGVEIPASLSRHWQPNGVLRLMFLGRIDPVKGLENLIEAIALLEGGSTRLDIYGAGSSDYVAHLKQLAASTVGETVRFRGHVEGEQKRQAFAEADICIVPSFTENFGMVVAEALAHGVPAIVGRGAPWSQVEERRCGLWVDNSPASLAAAISAMRHMDLEEMGKSGRRWMQVEFDLRAIADRTLEAMLSLLERGSLAGRTTKVGCPASKE